MPEVINDADIVSVHPEVINDADIVSVHAPDTSWGHTIRHWTVAPVEAATTMASGAGGKVLGDIAGLGAVGYGLLSGDLDVDPTKIKHQVEDAFTYKPVTSEGQDMVNDVNNIMSKTIGEGARAIGEGASQVTRASGLGQEWQDAARHGGEEAALQSLNFIGIKGAPKLFKMLDDVKIKEVPSYNEATKTTIDLAVKHDMPLTKAQVLASEQPTTQEATRLRADEAKRATQPGGQKLVDTYNKQQEILSNKVYDIAMQPGAGLDQVYFDFMKSKSDGTVKLDVAGLDKFLKSSKAHSIPMATFDKLNDINTLAQTVHVPKQALKDSPKTIPTAISNTTTHTGLGTAVAMHFVVPELQIPALVATSIKPLWSLAKAISNKVKSSRSAQFSIDNPAFDSAIKELELHRMTQESKANKSDVVVNRYRTKTDDGYVVTAENTKNLEADLKSGKFDNLPKAMQDRIQNSLASGTL